MDGRGITTVSTPTEPANLVRLYKKFGQHKCPASGLRDEDTKSNALVYKCNKDRCYYHCGS